MEMKMTTFGELTEMTAKAEYCAACGKRLGDVRLLVRPYGLAQYFAIHNDDHCREMFRAQHEKRPRATDTSSASWVW